MAQEAGMDMIAEYTRYIRKRNEHRQEKPFGYNVSTFEELIKLLTPISTEKKKAEIPKKMMEIPKIERIRIPPEVTEADCKNWINDGYCTAVECPKEHDPKKKKPDCTHWMNGECLHHIKKEGPCAYAHDPAKKAQKICWAWKESGVCYYDKCKYSHPADFNGEPIRKLNAHEICPFDLKGNCKYGNRCRKVHFQYEDTRHMWNSYLDETREMKKKKDNWKPRKCTNYQNGTCTYEELTGKKCKFSHCD